MSTEGAEREKEAAEEGLGGRGGEGGQALLCRGEVKGVPRGVQRGVPSGEEEVSWGPQKTLDAHGEGRGLVMLQ